MNKAIENLLYDRYAKLVIASKRAGLPYPSWSDYLTEFSPNGDLDNHYDEIRKPFYE